MTDLNKTEKNSKKTQIVIIINCLAIFFALWLMVEMGHASLIDDPVRNAIISMRTGWLTPIMKAITYMGNWQFITAVCIILLAFRKTRLAYGVPLSIGAIFVSTANKGIKALVMRPRPDIDMFLIEQGGWSFPSGHAITSMFFYGMAIWLIRKKIKNRTAANIMTLLLAIPMVFVGISRIYLGVHYPTDVMAGWCLGILAIVILQSLVKQ